MENNKGCFIAIAIIISSLFLIVIIGNVTESISNFYETAPIIYRIGVGLGIIATGFLVYNFYNNKKK
jgi:hypothetical protein